MSKLLKIGLPVLLLGAFFAYRMLTPKGPLDISAAATELSINAGSLYAAFETDETKANGTYVGKVLEVSGQLNAIDKNEDGSYQLKLAADNPLGQVVCTLTSGNSTAVPNAKIGSTATVKGVCTGYLFDVVIDNAIIIQ